MIAAAFTLLAFAGICFMIRLFVGETVVDRVIALDGLLMVITCGILVEAASDDSVAGLETVLVVALVAFVGTGVLARYVERRGA